MAPMPLSMMFVFLAFRKMRGALRGAWCFLPRLTRLHQNCTLTYLYGADSHIIFVVDASHRQQWRRRTCTDDATTNRCGIERGKLLLWLHWWAWLLWIIERRSPFCSIQNIRRHCRGRGMLLPSNASFALTYRFDSPFLHLPSFLWRPIVAVVKVPLISRWNVVQELFCAIINVAGHSFVHISRATSHMKVILVSLDQPSNSTWGKTLSFSKFKVLKTSQTTIYDFQNSGLMDEVPPISTHIFSQQSNIHFSHNKGYPGPW